MRKHAKFALFLSQAVQKRKLCAVWEMETFCRATLCVSAVFAVVRCPSVCLSVCLSVTLVDCIQTAEDFVKLLYRSGSPITLVFWPQRRYPIPRGTFSRDAKYTGMGKFCDFRLKSPFISETVRGPWLLWNVNRKSYALYRMVTISMTFTNS